MSEVRQRNMVQRLDGRLINAGRLRGMLLVCATGCCCPLGFEKCGPDCCTAGSIPAPQPGHSECCDQACCIGTCYGEELCCPTNNRSSGEFLRLRSEILQMLHFAGASAMA